MTLYSPPAYSVPAVLRTAPGIWNCGYDHSGKTSRVALRFTKLSNGWLLYTETNRTRPKTPQYIQLLGYDLARREYISFGSGSGWNVSAASAAPNATTITFRQVYPADPLNYASVLHFGRNRITSLDSWTDRGKRMTGRLVCVKQRAH